MNVDLLFGRDTIQVAIPDSADVSVIRKPDMPTLADPHRAVHDALVDLPKHAVGATLSLIHISEPTRPY